MQVGNKASPNTRGQHRNTKHDIPIAIRKGHHTQEQGIHQLQQPMHHV